jgi:hypothetical protein
MNLSAACPENGLQVLDVKDWKRPIGHMTLSKPVGFILFLSHLRYRTAGVLGEVLAIFHSGARNFLVRWVKVLRTLKDRAAALTFGQGGRRLCLENCKALP